MADEKLVFEQTFDGMFHRGLAGRITPRLKQQLLELGVDLDKPLLPAYPNELWEASLELAAREIYPALPMDDAQKRLGIDFIEGFQHTLLGRAMIGAMRLVGTRRTLERMTRTLRNADNFTSAELRVNAPNDCELVLYGETRNPWFMAGTFIASARYTGAKNERIEVLHWDPTSATYRIRWE